jgi:hypothetical protein
MKWPRTPQPGEPLAGRRLTALIPLTAVRTAYPTKPLLPDKSPAAEDHVIVR